MKKIILAVLSIMIAVSLTGCIGQGGPQLPGISTEDAVDIKKVDVSKYKDDLSGLEDYLFALKYMPENLQPTEMMYSAIGAKAGDRYNFLVDNSTVYVELYEFDPANLNSQAKRIIGEVKETGSFKVLSAEDEIEFPADLSENGKYLVLYTDSSNNDANVKRKENEETPTISVWSGFSAFLGGMYMKIKTYKQINRVIQRRITPQTFCQALYITAAQALHWGRTDYFQ